MKRRTLLHSGTSLALTGLLAACGGSDDPAGGDPSGPASPLDGYEPSIPGIGADEDGYQHVGGQHTLPPPEDVDWDYLASPTPGLGFAVRVQIGAQAQAGVAVHVIDVQGRDVAQGVTGADGLFTTAQAGRRFLMAVAQTEQGALYGFEYNSGAKFEPVIEVNLIGTLIYKLYERLPLTPEGLEYVVNAFFGVEYDTDLSDLAANASELDQELLRQEAEAAGMSVVAWLDALVDEVLQAIETGFDDAPDDDPAAPKRTGGGTYSPTRSAIRRGALKAAGPCTDVLEYDHAFNASIPTDLEVLVRDNWPKAAKALLGLAFTKGSAAAGLPWAGEIANFILGQALPEDDPHQRSLDAIQGQLSRLASAVSELSFKADFALHKAALDRVIASFNRLANLIKDIEDRKRRHVAPSDSEIAAYNRHVVTQSRKLLELQTELGEVQDLFIGLGSVPVADSVLARWNTAFRGKKFYTAVIEKAYHELLDWYVLWNTKIYNYLFDAYTTLAELDARPIDTVQVALLRERLLRTTLAIETLRPTRLQSTRLFIDTQYNLAWLGGCNKVEAGDYMRLVPPGIDMKWSEFGRSRYSLMQLMRREHDDPCAAMRSPWPNVGIGSELIGSFYWRLPTKKNMDDSFGDYIKQGYLGEFKTKTKDFNWGSFADNCQIPRAVRFIREDDGKTPIQVILSNGMQASYHSNFFFGVYWSLDASQFDLGNLKSKGIVLAEREIRQDNPHARHGPGYYFFPVAELTPSQAQEHLPWLRYEREINGLRR